MLTNASSLIGTTAITSLLGAIYWLVAARQFSANEVGLAAAYISAMTLLGAISMLGFGTLLTGKLHEYQGREKALIGTAVFVTGLMGGILGALFAVISPLFSTDLAPLSYNLANVILFAFGVSLTTITLVLDFALIGLLRGKIQFVRNLIFGITKLAALFLVGLYFSNGNSMVIYHTWTAGNLVSVLVLTVGVILRTSHFREFLPDFKLLKELGRAALGHHLLNLALQTPSLMLPLLVTVLLSAELNASFYLAWMLANFVFVASRALTTVLYAVGAAEPEALKRRLQFSLKLSLLIGLLANLVLWIGADYVMLIFGSSYAEQAGTILRILGLGVFPLIIRDHFLALSRIFNQITSTTKLMVIAGTVEIALAVTGAEVANLTGLSLGWLIALGLEALYMIRTVYRMATSGEMVDQTKASRSVALTGDKNVSSNRLTH